MHGAVHISQHQERTKDDDRQTGTYDEAAAESHGKHQYNDHDEDGLYEVEYKLSQGFGHSLGLIEHLVAIHSCRETLLLEFGYSLLHGLAHLHYVRRAGRSHEDAQGRLPVIGDGIAYRTLRALLHLGDVCQSELVVLMSLDDHSFYVLHLSELVGHGHTHSLVAIVIISSIGSLVLTVQRGQYLGGQDSQTGHLVLQQTYVYAILLLAIDIHTVHIIHVGQFALHQLGIVIQFPVRQSISREHIEHTIDQREVLLGDGGVGILRQQALGIVDLASETIPALLHLGIAHRTAKLHLYDGQVIVGVTLYIVQVAHGADAFLQHIGNLHLYLMGRSSRVCGNHHGQLDLYLGVFQLTHVIACVSTSQHEHGHEEIHQEPVVESPFAEIHHSSPPTFVLETGVSMRTFCPSCKWCTPDETTRWPMVRFPTTSAVPSV